MKQQVLDELTGFLSGIEQDLAHTNKTELGKRRVTTRIIKLTLSLMLVLLLVNSVLLYRLSTGLSDTLTMVDHISLRFAQVAGSMDRVTAAVESINVRFGALDSIDDDMMDVTGEVALIDTALNGISGTVVELSQDLYLVDRSMSHMDLQVSGMTGNMQNIGRDVNKMSGPMSFMNSFMPW